MTKTQELITPADVAKRLNVTTGRVRAMDDVLKPTRLQNGNRLYDPQVVERVRAKRIADGVQAVRDGR